MTIEKLESTVNSLVRWHNSPQGRYTMLAITSFNYEEQVDLEQYPYRLTINDGRLKYISCLDVSDGVSQARKYGLKKTISLEKWNGVRWVDVEFNTEGDTIIELLEKEVKEYEAV